MSTIRICDVCGDAIEMGEEVPSMYLPPYWWVALGIEPSEKRIDVCSTVCLVTLAEKADAGLTASHDPADGPDEPEVEFEGDEPEEEAQPVRFSQPRLHPPSPEDINRALGITERG